VKGKGASVDTEQRVPAQYLHVPVLDVEGPVGSYGRGVDGRFVVGSICDCEVGQSGDADGRRLDDGGHKNRFWLWGSVGFGWRGLRGLWFDTCVKTRGGGGRPSQLRSRIGL